jgi:hypothetical protein
MIRHTAQCGLQHINRIHIHPRTDAMLHQVSRNSSHTHHSLLLVGFMKDRVVDIWPELFRSERAEI